MGKELPRTEEMQGHPVLLPVPATLTSRNSRVPVTPPPPILDRVDIIRQRLEDSCTDMENRTLTWKRRKRWGLTTSPVSTLLMALGVPACCGVTLVTESQAT